MLVLLERSAIKVRLVPTEHRGLKALMDSLVQPGLLELAGPSDLLDPRGHLGLREMLGRGGTSGRPARRAKQDRPVA